MTEQVTYNSPDGATFGKSATEKISFYGATPIVRYPDAGAASTYLLSSSVGIWGLNSAAAITSLVAQVSQLTVALRNTGLIT